MVDNAPTEVNVGTHFFRWEPPDIAYIAYVGDLDGKSMAALSQASRRSTLQKPSVFLLVDMSKVGKIAGDARRVAADGSKDLALRGIAVVGASAHLRIIAGLVSRAVDLLHHNTDNPTRFFETEAQGREWIKGRREAIALQSGG